ncbi:MAG: hypothetical protein ABIQ40_06720 [Bacteroidia bacterium]
MHARLETGTFCFAAFFITSIAARLIGLAFFMWRTIIRHQTETRKDLFGGFMIGSFFAIVGAFLNSIPAFFLGLSAPAIIQENYTHGIILAATCFAAIADASLLVLFREPYGKLKIYVRLLVSASILTISWTIGIFL